MPRDKAVLQAPGCGFHSTADSRAGRATDQDDGTGVQRVSTESKTGSGAKGGKVQFQDVNACCVRLRTSASLENTKMIFHTTFFFSCPFIVAYSKRMHVLV
ncbi:unnamed protein product [Amoebophrya sp. A120]|nr:unnamed protein product [Amoebophrya sp. A120]|eukprot:GSA120T00003687001.1